MIRTTHVLELETPVKRNITIKIPRNALCMTSNGVSRTISIPDWYCYVNLFVGKNVTEKREYKNARAV